MSFSARWNIPKKLRFNILISLKTKTKYVSFIKIEAKDKGNTSLEYKWAIYAAKENKFFDGNSRDGYLLAFNKITNRAKTKQLSASLSYSNCWGVSDGGS